jgi:ribose/xylose/arabinose/galactoside ABC-type transport system permease subunit
VRNLSSVLAGTSLSSSYGTIFGTVIGTILVGVLVNDLVLMNVNAYTQQAVIGAIIAVAVAFGTFAISTR